VGEFSIAELELAFLRARRRAQRRHARADRRRAALAFVARAAVAAGVVVTAVVLVGHSRAADSSSRRTAEATPSIPAGCPVPPRFAHAFASAARATDLPLGLLVAVAYRESRFDPAARSRAGARGLLQLMPATARELRLATSDPATNVLAGARYLRRMLDRFRGDVDLALSAYNAGPTAVTAAGGAPSAETLTYVANVKASWRALGACG
jgi:soluble lytic murein transglycosylase-like protein